MSTRTRVIAAAERWLGTPYRHQGSTRGVGADCLGLVRGVWLEIYGVAPEDPGPYQADWAEAGGEDRLMDAAGRHCTAVAVAAAQPGDLVLFRWRPHLPAKHAGILATSDSFIHAYEGHAVTVSSLVPQWRRRIAGCFAFPPSHWR
ncbi:MAG: NlpC/P60 family protein [Mesorhizobium sp.]